MIRIAAAGAVLAFVLVACVTPPESPPVPSLPEARLRDARTEIDSGSFLQALQEISLMQADVPKGMRKADLDDLETRALDALGKAFQKAVSEKKFDDALRLYRSATYWGRPDIVAGWTEESLSMELAGALDAKGDKLLSLLSRMRAIASADPTEAELSDTLSYASHMGNVPAERQILDQMKRHGFATPAGSLPDAGSPDYQKMLKGTVTIWVNRGIRIERGVGYPDQVIGSGFFIDPRGYLLTNYHVIKSEVDPKYKGYSRLYIRLSDNTEDKIPAKVVGYDSVFDLALIKVEVPTEYVFSGLSTEEVHPGDKVFAIGSPAGLENTITSGIVSATGRRFLQIGDTLQVDAPVNPGNSGGPLLNEKGDLIGVVFAGLQQFPGINFAVPYFWIEKVLPGLFRGGEVKHPWMGMALEETDKGLRVIYTVPEEPARKAGIQSGDIIEKVNGLSYKKIRDIQEAVLGLEPPSLVRVSFNRAGAEHEAVLCTTPRPQSPIELALKRDTRDNVLYPLFGMKVEKVGTFLWTTDYIVRNVARGSVADESGVSENDPLSIQDWQVDTDKGYAVLQIYIKKKKAGFIESVIQIASYLETDNFT